MNYDFSNFPIDLILNILNIVILFVIVRFLVYKPVKKFMDARTARVTAAAEDAGAKAKSFPNSLGLSLQMLQTMRTV